MQNKFLPVLLAATLMTCAVRAQENAAPAAAPAPQPAAAPTVAQTAPTPNQIIYAPRLPSANELTNAASAQGMTVEQIVQGPNQVTVIYRNANGQTNTVAYQLLPTPTSPAPATVVVPSPAPTVVYQPAPNVVYYESYAPYYPRYYYPPVSLHLGFGYGGYYRGGWGGGYHHWR